MSEVKDLRQRLAEGLVLCDGGMGTQLIESGLAAGTCGMLWNVERPEVIEAIARRYVQAGCELLTSNSFGGTRTALAMYGLAERVAELNEAAARVACAAAGGADRRCYVLGDVGPFGGFLEPLGEMTVDALTGIFTEQIGALRAGGADGVIIETMSDPAELVCAVQAARSFGDWPVLATYAFEKAGAEFATMMGVSVERALGQAVGAGAHAVGANCGTGLSLDDYRRLAERLVAAADDRPVILQPNAGSPKQVEGKVVYDAGPQAMAELAVQLRGIGVRVMGGCCGTTPKHLEAMAKHLNEF